MRAITIDIPKAKYVVAVSGGVDSMVLLDLLTDKFGSAQLLVAHYRHNVRSAYESDRDKQVIDKYCQTHNLQVHYGEYLEGNQSEDDLRTARYKFLNQEMKQNHYNVIITAHHRDDLLETAIINLLRGTKGKGLNSITNQGKLLRPLLRFNKQQILKYAKEHEVKWHEDSTNSDRSYLRNYVRLSVVPKLKDDNKLDSFNVIVDEQLALENQIAEKLDALLVKNVLSLDNGLRLARGQFIGLPNIVSQRLLRELFADAQFKINISQELIRKATIFAKTAQLSSSMDLSSNSRVTINGSFIDILANA